MRIHRSAAVGLACVLGASLAVGTAPPAAAGSTSPCSLPPNEIRWSSGEVAAAFGFEDGGLGGWAGTGPVEYRITDEAAASGSHSLQVDHLTTTGTSVTFQFSPEHFGWYEVTVRARVKAPATVAYVSLRPRTNDPARSVMGAARVTADGWATVTAYLWPEPQTSDLCSGTSSNRPSSTQVELRVIPPVCGVPATGPVSVYLDDAAFVTADSSDASGSPSPIPTPYVPVPPPLGCPASSPATSTSPTSTSPTSTSPTSTSPTSTSPAPGPCLPGFSVASTWPGGYLATVTARNLGTTTLSSWTLTWTFPDDQRVTSLWGARSWAQTGRTVTVTGPDWAPLAPGGTVSVGFIGSFTGAGVPALPRQLDIHADGRLCGALA